MLNGVKIFTDSSLLHWSTSNGSGEWPWPGTSAKPTIWFQEASSNGKIKLGETSRTLRWGSSFSTQCKARLWHCGWRKGYKWLGGKFSWRTAGQIWSTTDWTQSSWPSWWPPEALPFPSPLLAGTDPASFKVGHASWYLCNNYNFLSFAEVPGFSFFPQIHFLTFRYPISHALLQNQEEPGSAHLCAVGEYIWNAHFWELLKVPNDFTPQIKTRRKFSSGKWNHCSGCLSANK